MKVLSIHQPSASLFAIGVRTIETRSWATKHRGRIGIASTKRRPTQMHLPPLARGRGPEVDEHNGRTWLVIDTITDPAHKRPHRQGERVPTRAQTPTLFYPHRGPHGRPHTPGTPATEQGTAIYLPLGALVATANLVDCVPMVAEGDLGATGGTGPLIAVSRTGEHVTFLTYEPNAVSPGRYIDKERTEDLIGPNRPYGDFIPGRWAWLLDDVQATTERCPACWGDATLYRNHPEKHNTVIIDACPSCKGRGACDPIPVKGHQGLWTWAVNA